MCHQEVYQAVQITAMSIYAKQGERKYIRLLYDDGTNAANAVFNLDDGEQSEYTQTTAQIEDAGTDGIDVLSQPPLEVLQLTCNHSYYVNDSLQTSYTGDTEQV